MLIRPMSVADPAGLAILESSVLSGWNEKQIAAELQRQAGAALVAAGEGGDLWGWCCGLYSGNDAELLKITVHPERRNNGIASALLQDLELLFVGNGASQLFLEVRFSNTAARALYEKRGFQQTGRRKKYYKNPVDDALILVHRMEDGKNQDNSFSEWTA